MPIPRLTPSLLIALIPCLALSLAACDRRTAPYVPADQEPPPPERPVRIPGLATAPPTDRDLSARPLSAGATGAARGSASGASIEGAVRLGEGSEAPSGGILFVVARTGAAGPPLAVERIEVGSFPMTFSLGPDDVMIAGRPFVGPIQLSARVDADGDPLTRGDVVLEAALEGTVEPGAADVELILRPR